MYSRVGTKEWNDEVSDKKINAQAKEEIDRTFVTIDDKKINAGLEQLQREEKLDQMTPEEVFEFIQSVRIVKKSTQFAKEAVTVLQTSKIADLIRGRVVTAIQRDDELSRLIADALIEQGVGEDAELPRQIAAILARRVGVLLERERFPDLDSLCEKVVASITQDTKVSTILSSP